MSKSITRRSAHARRGAVPEEIARAVEAAASKKATDIVVLDLRKAAAFTDYFVICTGQNARQIRAIAEAVEDALARMHVKPSHVEGRERSEWVLLDYFDFVVHVFSGEMRSFYALERLWGSATTIELPDLTSTAATPR